ncbi:MAG: GlmU family protein [bacterium]
MSLQLCIFEDEKTRRFLPLCWTRPVYDLVCGMDSLREKILRAYAGVKVSFACRDYLAGVMREENPGTEINTLSEERVLFVNGRVLADPGMASIIPLDGEETVYLSGDDVVAVRATGGNLEKLMTKLSGFLKRDDFEIKREVSVDAVVFGYIWDLVLRNGRQIAADIRARHEMGGIAGKVHEGVRMLNPSSITVEKDAVVKPGVVLDAEDGPVFIDEGAEIFPNAVIQGPAYVGRRSKIKIGAKIYEGTSIGEMCKVGGEVEESIIHAYSNKQHDGFLGHAYLGMWVNLGADTNNSDLKNNYGSVKVFVDGEYVDSRETFVGLMMGDHSKTGINTMINTGSVVGVCCNVFGAEFPPKFVPSFSWGGGGRFSEYAYSKALETARRVMARRQVETTEAYENMLREVFERTAGHRKQFGKASLVE